MIYKIKFLPSAQVEWDKLDNSVKQPLLKALHKRLSNPVVPKDRLN
ncbi:MAG: hypothetical protein QG673_976 [Pseudomonadota bacterium]|nr:hypothetical protein [Pseudomonadota bacterium]